MLCGSNSLCTDAVKNYVYVWIKGEKAKHFVSCMKALSPHRYISLDWHHVQTSTFSVSPFVYNPVVFYSLFRGTRLFVHTLAVMSQFVEWGMMCCWEWIFFSKLNYWSNRIFKLLRNIRHFITFHLCLKIGFALLYSRWLEVLVTYFDNS